MKILLYSHFYSPEVGAASIRMQYFVNALKNAGHEVKVITPVPNYPQSKSYTGFDKKYRFDKLSNVHYLPLFLPRKFSMLKRGLHYISYCFSSLFYGLISDFNPDLIISSSPPITTTLAAVIFAKIKRKPIILDIRDLWPDIGIELGLIKNIWLVKILKSVDKFVLKNSNAITVPLNDFVNLVGNKGFPKDNIFTIYNGADTEVFKPITDVRRREIREKYNIPIDKKVLIYFGFFNFGMNDIETLKQALIGLADLKDEIHILLLGDGVQKNDFISSIEGKVNFTHISSQPQKIVAKIIAACDVSIIPLKKIERHTGGFIPVKCLESWAAALPVVMSCNSDKEIQQIFKDNKAGKLVKTGNSKLLGDAIREFTNSDELKELGIIGREYVVKNFDRRKESKKLIKIIDEYFRDK